MFVCRVTPNFQQKIGFFSSRFFRDSFFFFCPSHLSSEIGVSAFGSSRPRICPTSRHGPRISLENSRESLVLVVIVLLVTSSGACGIIYSWASVAQSEGVYLSPANFWRATITDQVPVIVATYFVLYTRVRFFFSDVVLRTSYNITRIYSYKLYHHTRSLWIS